MKKSMLIITLAIAACACAFGQIDRSKEVKAIVTERPAVEHFYSCPVGYDLKYFVKATRTMGAVYAENVSMYGDANADRYDTAPTQDILRTGEPTCVPAPWPLFVSGRFASCCSDFVFQTADGQSVRIHLKTGEVETPKGWPADKAAKEFWEFLKRYAKNMSGVSDK